METTMYMCMYIVYIDNYIHVSVCDPREEKCATLYSCFWLVGLPQHVGN